MSGVTVIVGVRHADSVIELREQLGPRYGIQVVSFVRDLTIHDATMAFRSSGRASLFVDFSIEQKRRGNI